MMFLLGVFMGAGVVFSFFLEEIIIGITIRLGTEIYKNMEDIHG